MSLSNSDKKSTADCYQTTCCTAPPPPWSSTPSRTSQQTRCDQFYSPEKEVRSESVELRPHLQLQLEEPELRHVVTSQHEASPSAEPGVQPRHHRLEMNSKFNCGISECLTRKLLQYLDIFLQVSFVGSHSRDNNSTIRF